MLARCSSSSHKLLALLLLLSASGLAAQASVVATWFPLYDSGAGVGTPPPSSGLNTGSPVIGDGTAASAKDVNLWAAFPDLTLVNAGDSITFTASVTLTGMTSSARQFRWGLFNVNGSSNLTGWLGWQGAQGTGANVAGTQGRFYERNNPDTNPFYSTTGATTVSTFAATGTSPTFLNNTYNIEFQATRQVDNSVTLSWFLNSTDGTSYLSSGSFNDTTPQTYLFDRVGILLGSTLNTSQASFSNMDVTLTSVPEPASSALLLLGAVGSAALLRRHRRK